MLGADDALDGLEMLETPKLEIAFEIDQHFGQMIGLEMSLRIGIDRLPGLEDTLAEFVRLRPVARQPIGRNNQSATVEIMKRRVIEARCLEDFRQLLVVVRFALMRDQILLVLFARARIPAYGIPATETPTRSPIYRERTGSRQA